MPGRYSLFFRGGDQSNSRLELLHKSLNESLGTGFTSEENTIISTINYVIAKEFAYAYEFIDGLSSQQLPFSMSIFLSRWEKILGIYPSANSSLYERRKIIAAKFKLKSKPPTVPNISDAIRSYIGDVFIRLEFNRSTQNRGKFPGGLAIPGGVTLADGNWTSNLSTLKIHIWQPRDKDENLLMSNAKFQSLRNSFNTFLINYLPAYMNFSTVRYVTKLTGTISVASGTKNLTGSGTLFLSQLIPGTYIEVVDEANQVQVFEVDTITNNTAATLVLPSFNGVASRNGYIQGGFFLDYPKNLDNLSF
jgi:hypothetical protein